MRLQMGCQVPVFGLVVILIMCSGCREKKNLSFGIFGGKLCSRKRSESMRMVPYGTYVNPMLQCCICFHDRQERNDGWQRACSPCIIDPFQMRSPKVWLRKNVAYYQYYDFFRQLWRGFVGRVDE